MLITISREFGSGGRELGRRLADALGIPCYDNEIIQYVASQGGFDENYVSHVGEKSIRPFYLNTIAHRLTPVVNTNTQLKIQLVAEQRKIIEGFAAAGDCVIVGRSADVILADYRPMNIFVYASTESKVKRTLSRQSGGENLSAKEIEKRMKEIDRGRAAGRRDYSYTKWGDKENYHLCINTTDAAIKDLIPGLASYVKAWFATQEK